MGLEVRARLAALHLDRGNPAEAARALEPVVLELRAAQQRSQARPHKNEWMASLYLGAAYVAGEHPQKGWDVLREVVLPLEELNQQGRSDFNAVLAQARVNEAQALLRLGKIESAAHASERSVCLYETLMAKGATQFQGQLSNALFKRAEARIRSGAETECREDLRRALALATDWIAAWFGECNFQSVFIGNAVQILPLLTRGFDVEKREMLEMIKQCRARNTAVPHPSKASLRENEILAEKWPKLKAAALEIGVQWEETPVSNNVVP